ncbi:serine hydrolase domain-containing protein [Peteryoungia ipomoeae]|nr:serine hydrolase [Peteryoungia ipomoeae]
MKIWKAVLGAGVAVVGVAVASAVVFVPVDLLKVGTGYAAKIVCSNVFIAGRDADDVLALDVQAPGHPLLRLVSVDVSVDDRRVTAAMPLSFAASTAVYRDGLGCANVEADGLEAAKAFSAPVAGAAVADPMRTWPEGALVGQVDSRLREILADEALLGPGYRAVVIVKDGRILGEAYGDRITPETPLLGWSMAKTVNAALVGILAGQGGVDLDDDQLFEGWRDRDHARIRLADLLAMESGIDFNESYGDLADVTRMLYLERDMAGYVQTLGLAAAPEKRFNYSSGDSVLIARHWMSKLPTLEVAHEFPRRALFDPLGMDSAVLEADARGTFVGSSYLYATAHDWARFGLLLANDGVWQGRQIVPLDFIARMKTPSSASNGAYSQAQTWLKGPGDEDGAGEGDTSATLWMLGHDGQSIAVDGGTGLVVVRLGLTPAKLGYRPQPLLKAIRDALD